MPETYSAQSWQTIFYQLKQICVRKINQARIAEQSILLSLEGTVIAFLHSWLVRKNIIMIKARLCA